MVLALGHVVTVDHEQQRREDLLPLDGQQVTALIGFKLPRTVTGTLVLPEVGDRIATIVGPDRSWLAPLGELHEVNPL